MLSDLHTRHVRQTSAKSCAAQLHMGFSKGQGKDFTGFDEGRYMAHAGLGAYVLVAFGLHWGSCC